MAIAAVIGAAGSLLSGFAAFQQSQYQAAVAEANAKQARLNAKLAVDVGMDNVQDIGEENAGRLGLQAARMGASGIDVGSPSFSQARARGRQLNVLEQSRTIESAYREAANYRTQANVFDTEADAARSAGGLSLIGGFLGAAGSVAGSSRPSGTSGPGLFNRRASGNNFYNSETRSPALSRRFRYWNSYGTGFNTGY